MAIYVAIRDGMTQATEDDLMHFDNEYVYQAGVITAGSLEVTQRGAGANMSVDVSGGRAYILNSSYTTNGNATKYWFLKSGSTTNVTITSNSSGNPRIDIIVAKVNTSTTPDATASNIGSIYAIAGTPAASPSAPATPSDCLLLAQVAVASGATSIVDANITDARVMAAIKIPDGNQLVYTVGSDAVTLEYAGTNPSGTPDGDGYRFRYDPTYAGYSGTGDFFIYEKTDGNAANPDGGFLWVFTGNDGVVEESLEIGGDGNMYLHDANRFYFLNSGDTAGTYIEQGTNFSIVGVGSMGYFDIDVSSGSNAVRLKAGADLYAYNAANTQYGLAAYETNWAFSTSSGEIQMNPNSTFRVTSGTNIVMTPGSGYDVYITAGASLIMRNSADTSKTELYTDSTGKFNVDPDGTEMIVDGYIGAQTVYPNTTGTYGLGDPTHYWAIGYIDGVAAQSVLNFYVAATGGFNFDASTNAQYIILPKIAGTPSGVSDGMIWYDTTANLFKVREAGATRTM